MKKPHILCILDGWGIGKSDSSNAIYKAYTPTYDRLYKHHLHSTLDASGPAVGLPIGQMGNSEVGHLTIGAGRTIPQDLVRINQAMHNGKKYDLAMLENALIRDQNQGIHLFCLLSDGGIHSTIDHLNFFIKFLADFKGSVFIHGITDGRDTPPRSALGYLETLMEQIKPYAHMQIATLGGRFYYMDRDSRWDRLQASLNAISTPQSCHQFACAREYIEDCYNSDICDEFIKPGAAKSYCGIKSQDLVLMVNFRADRVRQLLRALYLPNFTHLKRASSLPLEHKGFGMVDYAEDLKPFLTALFPRPKTKETLGEIISKAHLKQLRLAETEKFAHVTYFFNGGAEEPFAGEERVLIPSPKVKTYDLSVQMSAQEITLAAIESLKMKAHDVIIMNYANADMVGHTGNMEATIATCEYVDLCLKALVQAVDETGAVLLLTADHGNADEMIDSKDGTRKTAHSKNFVPFIIYSKTIPAYLGTDPIPTGTLADVAPTLLASLGLTPPEMMFKKSIS